MTKEMPPIHINAFCHQYKGFSTSIYSFCFIILGISLTCKNVSTLFVLLTLPWFESALVVRLWRNTGIPSVAIVLVSIHIVSIMLIESIFHNVSILVCMIDLYVVSWISIGTSCTMRLVLQPSNAMTINATMVNLDNDSIGVISFPANPVCSYLAFPVHTIALE